MKTRTACLVLVMILAYCAANAQWIQTSGPESGEAICLAVVGNDLFVGTELTVYRSTNNGTSWSATALTNTFVFSLAVGPSSGTDTCLYAGLWGGVARSTDHGASWTRVDFGLRDYRVVSLAVKDTDVFAGTDSGGVFLKPNNEDYWIPVNEGLTCLEINAVAAIGGDLYVATDSGLFRSSGEDVSWNLLGLMPQHVRAVAAIDTILFAGTDTNGVYRSTDDGASWERISDPDMDRGTGVLAVIPPNLFAGTGMGVYRTSNNGDYWIPSNTGLRNRIVESFCVKGTDLFVGTYGGVFRSTNNGVSWSFAAAGLKTTVIEAMAARGSTLYAAGRNGIFRSTNGGDFWSHVVSTWARAIALDGMNVYAATWGHLNYSLNDGATWDFLPLAGTSGMAYAIAVVDTELLVGTQSDGVLRVPLPVQPFGPVTTTDLKDTAVYALAVSGADMFAGTDGGVFRSTNGGVNWTAANNGITKHPVYAFALNGTGLLAGTGSGGMFFSTDRGVSWTELGSGLAGEDILSIAANGDNVLAGTWQGGVFVSSNSGVNWRAVNEGLQSEISQPVLAVHALVIVGTDVYAGTRGAGVWRRPLSEMVTATERASGEVPRTCCLQQNFPNPFNPITTVRYELSISLPVHLSVHDLLGREMSVLVNERKEAGVHEVMFDASHLSSGVYLYRLTAGEFVQSMKLIVLK